MLHKCLQYLIWFLIKTLISTYRIEVRGKDRREKAKIISPHGSFVFAVWHEQVVSVMSAHAWTEPYLSLASRSKDGDYAAFVAEKMGFVAVRGSSRKRNKDKGGKEAIQEYVTKMKLGANGGITVDGPKGPRQKCKAGVVLIAQQTGSPILPVVGLAEKYWEFNSWDRFKIPKPFTKVVLHYGEPVFVEADASNERIDELCEMVSQNLKALEQQVLQDKW